MTFSRETYIKRRDILKKDIHDGVILLLGNGEVAYNAVANTYKFRQDSTFLYFFGLNLPDFAALIDTETGQEWIFGDDVDIDDIVWMGPQPSVAELAEQAGVIRTKPLSELGTAIKNLKNRRIHFLPPCRYRNRMQIHELLGIAPDAQQSLASVPLIKAVVAQRSTKSYEELNEIRMACNIGYSMHTTAMRMCRPGETEQRITGVIEGISATGGLGVSFPTILSQHGETLHNHYHGDILKERRLMIVDAGAERFSGYCSDFTRTTPVGGRFTTRQREIYTIVERCNALCRRLARPGVPYMDIHLEVCRELTRGLIDLGLMRGDVDEAVAAGAHALFLPHGLGHMMGLDVHDMEDLGQIYVGFDDEVRPSTQFGTSAVRMGRRLETGFVVTDEPGCYFIPELINRWRADGLHRDFLNYDVIETYKDFGGIRVEDDIVITETGCRLLGDHEIPRTADEVESFVCRL